MNTQPKPLVSYTHCDYDDLIKTFERYGYFSNSEKNRHKKQRGFEGA